MFKKFTEHPKENGETYFQHMAASWKIIHTLKVIELKCFVHSVFPFLFVDALSDKIECLENLVERKVKKTESDEDFYDLYEVYGGD